MIFAAVDKDALGTASVISLIDAVQMIVFVEENALNVPVQSHAVAIVVVRD